MKLLCDDVDFAPIGIAVDITSSIFPGPLFLDPSSPKGSAADKSKKASILAYLDTQATEIEQGLAWIKGKGDEIQFREQEGKAVLLRLLAVMIGNDGRLMGRLVEH